MSEGNPDVLLMGDMNVDLLTVRAANTKKYENFLRLNRMEQLMEEPTRISGRSTTLIDHIVVNRPEFYYQHGPC